MTACDFDGWVCMEKKNGEEEMNDDEEDTEVPLGESFLSHPRHTRSPYAVH